MRIFLLLAAVNFMMLSCSKDSKNPSESILEPEESGTNLLYSSNKNGHNELYRLNLDSNETQVLLTDSNYDFWWPKVSPDKSKFLVYRSVADANKNHDNYEEAELMLYDIDGSNPTVLIEKGKYDWLAQGVCRWNKDGTKIIMASVQQVAEGQQWRLLITDAEGNNPKNLSDWWIIDPNFSVDNTEVIFIAFPDNVLSFNVTELELHKAEFDADNDTLNNITRLTTNFTRDHDPSFSPDGTKIVFSAGNADYTDVDLAIYDLNLETETDILDDNGSNGGSMDWSPDGSEIYFHSLNLTQHPFQIKKIDYDSKETTTLLKSEATDFGFFHPESY